MKRLHIYCLSLLFVFAACGGSDNSEGNDAGDCWYCIDAGEVADSGKGDDKPDDKPDGKGDTNSALLNGQYDSESGEGFIKVFIAGKEDDSILCDLTYPIANGVPSETCAQCEFAWKLTVGTAEISVDTECSFWSALAGVVFDYGHSAAGTLYVGKNDSWSDVGGMSMIEGTLWTFSYTVDK